MARWACHLPGPGRPAVVFVLQASLITKLTLDLNDGLNTQRECLYSLDDNRKGYPVLMRGRVARWSLHIETKPFYKVCEGRRVDQARLRRRG